MQRARLVQLSIRALVAAVLLLGLVDAIRLAWVCDDAFISFRYAENLANGSGLTYNAGERVEGYSNFLWTVLVSIALRAGLDAVAVSMVMGVLAYAGTLVLLIRTSLRAAPDGERRAFVLCVAAILLVMHRHAREFATGGLETSLFAFLVTAVVVLSVEASTARGHLLAGFVAVLAALCRPDGALFLIAPLIAPIGEALASRRMRNLAAAAAPIVGVYAPYLIWKLWYYGSVLPNTFHAKAAYLASYSRGFVYLASYFEAYYWLALGLAGPALCLVAARGDSGREWRSARGMALILGACAVYLAFVARVGGDFMFARFCVPITPLLCLGIGLAILRLPRSRQRAIAACVVIVAALFRPHPDTVTGAGEAPTGIVLEREFYPATAIAEARRLGAQLREATAGIPVRVAIYGSQAMLAYYARLPWVLEAHAGLTDRELAHAPLPSQGRAGHERMASLADLRRRDVDLVLEFGLFRPQSRPWTALRIGDLSGVLVSHRPEIVEALRARPGVVIVDFQNFLDAYLARVATVPTEQLQSDIGEFREFYFARNPDPAREEALRTALANRNP